MTETLYTPAQVAERLGITASMVRRYGLAYEAVIGEELPRDRKTRARLYDDQALGVLEQARAVVKENPTLGAEEAVRACLGIATATVPPTMPAVVAGEVLELLRSQAMLMQAQAREVQELRTEVRGLREQLQALPQLQELQPPESVDQDLVANLKRRNAYLAGELKRRDAEPQQSRLGQFFSRFR